MSFRSDGCDYMSVNMIYMGLNSSFSRVFYTVTTLQNPTSTGKTIRFRCLDSPHFFCWQEKIDPCFPEFRGGEKTIPFKCMEEKGGERSVSALETGRVSAVVLRRKGSELSVASLKAAWLAVPR